MAKKAARKIPDSAILAVGRKSVEEESQEVPEADGQPAASKADIVRQAIAQGLDKPGDIVDFAHSRGVELTKMAASSYKAQIKAREAKAGGDYQPRTRTSAQQPVGIPSGFGSDVREIRSLIEKLGGAEDAKEMIGQLTGLIGKYGAGGLGEIIDALG